MLNLLSMLLRLLGRKHPPAGREAAELDARFREALASGEITGDIVAVDKQGREVQRKISHIFDP